MDKNTLLGLGLIGLILIAFTFYNQPSKEELQKQQDEMLQREQFVADSLQAIELAEQNKERIEATLSQDTINPVFFGDTIDLENNTTLAFPPQKDDIIDGDDVTEKTYTLENEKLALTFTNRGGGVKKVYLKEYQTYHDFMKNKGTDKVDPLLFMDESAACNGIKFKKNGTDINTKQLIFRVSEQSDNGITFVANFENGKSIEQQYTISEDNYHINYAIKMNGFEKDVDSEDVYIDWQAELLSTEKSLDMERRVSTVFYSEKDGDKDKYQYLSEMSDDEKDVKNDINWVAFKQSYFSSIMIPEKKFHYKGTHLEIQKFNEKDPKGSTHIKRYNAQMNLAINNTASGSVSILWYFGPNDYDILASYNNGTKDIINYGWGLFRWINIGIIQPLFNWLVKNGLNIGLAILVLTVIIKLFLTPIQWKMFTSSMKMKILKPEIDEINKKYPNKEDAMKKQMETMTLYRESGASPMAGCLPSLIQMPILVAVFRFFPSAFSIRQQGFLWAEDLSSFDAFINFGFSIPLLGAHLSLFALLMSISTLFYTLMNSGNMTQPTQPGMPNMKIIMYFMPVMMIFFFNSYASGLSYYYFISTLMSILTMLIIKYVFIDEEKLKEKMVAKKAENQKEGKKGKSKFQQRLEEMQKMQQERMKQQQSKQKRK